MFFRQKEFNIFLWVIIFSVAMAFLESAVVIYLREIYYPNGFSFPLVTLKPIIAITELGRELATLIMLVAIGILVGKNNLSKFAYFLLSFAVWDIFYYVFLKLILNWPNSWFTWDILFLIPIAWVGPVIAPIIVSFSMIVLAILLLLVNEKTQYFKLGRYSWLGLITGSFIVIYAFVQDYLQYMLQQFNLYQIFVHPLQNELVKYSLLYIPKSFNWMIFYAGELLICIVILKLGLRLVKREY